MDFTITVTQEESPIILLTAIYRDKRKIKADKTFKIRVFQGLNQNAFWF
jgi:hypothetical protein